MKIDYDSNSKEGKGGEEKNKKKIKIGFIGQGWIGKNYADNFEKRGYQVIRYGLEEPYKKNGDNIKECDIVFIAVPTPTTPQGFDDSILKQAIQLVGDSKIAVIKSTILPGTTESIQKENPKVYVMHSPEFLTEARAAYDAAYPQRNIIGLPVVSDEYRKKAEEVLAVLPKAPYKLICRAQEAELIKYGGNCWFYFKVIFFNLLYDLAEKLGLDYDVIKEAMAADPRIGSSHLQPIHSSRNKTNKEKLNYNDFHFEPIHKTGRGAGGHCFIKDFAAFSEMYKKYIGDEIGIKVLESLRDKNIDLLVKSNKDLDLLTGVYGDEIIIIKDN